MLASNSLTFGRGFSDFVLESAIAAHKSHSEVFIQSWRGINPSTSLVAVGDSDVVSVIAAVALLRTSSARCAEHGA